MRPGSCCGQASICQGQTGTGRHPIDITGHCTNDSGPSGLQENCEEKQNMHIKVDACMRACINTRVCASVWSASGLNEGAVMRGEDID